jgi:chromosome segregation ATPase
LTYPDLAQALQARILANLKAGKGADTPRNRPDEPRGVGDLEAYIATLEKAVAKADALGEQRRQEAERAAKQVKDLEAKIATLEEAITKAEAVVEQRRQEARAETKRANDLVAELVEMTSELVEMSKRMAEQTAAMDKMRLISRIFGHGRGVGGGGGNAGQDNELVDP